jgi:uncharacterized protein YdhG (YjbR/CyaY superfamily)
VPDLQDLKKILQNVFSWVRNHNIEVQLQLKYPLVGFKKQTKKINFCVKKNTCWI